MAILAELGDGGARCCSDFKILVMQTGYEDIMRFFNRRSGTESSDGPDRHALDLRDILPRCWLLGCLPFQILGQKVDCRLGLWHSNSAECSHDDLDNLRILFFV